MKNKFYTVLTIVVLMLLFLMIFIYSKDVTTSVLFSISIWKDNLLPTLFPFFLVSDLLIEYGFIEIISCILGKCISKIFHLPKEASFAIFTSLFSGFPSGSKYTKDLLDKKMITEKDANHLIMFTHYSNPIFIISTIGILLLNSKKAGYIILACHILSNLIIGILFRQRKKIIVEKEKLSHVISEINNKRINGKSFITILMNSIIKSFSILINMLGIIIFFLILTTLLKKIIILNNFNNAIFSGILEMTQGVKYISEINTISLKIKSCLIGFLISFSGISVHFQVKSIIEGTSIQYKRFLIARIIHAILCFILIYIFF